MMDTKTARLVRKTALAPDTSDFLFEIEDGRMSGLEPGAHIDVHLSEGLIRQYSLWSWTPNGQQLNVAVKREEDGRGGSAAMHALTEGQEVTLGGPRNHFPLREGSDYVTLIAGGIGATPMVAMARALLNAGRDFQVFYLVRSKEYAAMDAKFRELGLNEWYHLHCSDTAGRLDLAEVLQAMPAGSDVYTCGPESMLNAVLEAGKVMRGGTIHFERFAASSEEVHDQNTGFEIELRGSAKVLQVGADQTILEVLQANEIPVDFGCSEGLCGSCMVDVLDGEIDHRDGILTPEEQSSNSYMCTCVSRAKSPRLVLDI